MLLQKGVQLARSLIILYIMLLLGNLISHYIPVGIPGSIWGLLLLFLGLTTHVISPGVDLFRLELIDPLHGRAFCTGERGHYQIL